MYKCFTRTWWKENASWPMGLEPCAGKRTYIKGARFNTEAGARGFCREWNEMHDAGLLSRKAEFEEC